MGQMQILVRDGWTVAVTALYHPCSQPALALPYTAALCGNTCVHPHTAAWFCSPPLPCFAGVGQQQCGWRAEYRRRRGRTTGTAGNTFDANMDSLQQIYTPWIRSDGDAPRGNNKEFRIQKALLTEAISTREVGFVRIGVDGAWCAHECCGRRPSRFAREGCLRSGGRGRWA